MLNQKTIFKNNNNNNKVVASNEKTIATANKPKNEKKTLYN